MLLPLLFTACTPEPAAEATPAPATWSVGTDAPSTPSLTAADIESGVNEALALTAQLDPAVLFDAYDQVMRQQDATCPTVDPSYFPQLYWEDECATGGGTAFSGWALASVVKDVRFSSEICAIDGYYFGFSQVGGSTAWQGMGEQRDRECTRDDGTSYAEATWRGEFRYPDAGWLELPLSLSLYAVYEGAPEANTVWLSGGINGLNGAVQAVSFDDLRHAEPGAGALDDCDDEPDGGLIAYGTDGFAYAVVFGGTCDGCGEVSSAGVEIGLLCPELAPLLDWEGRPWSP